MENQTNNTNRDADTNNAKNGCTHSGSSPTKPKLMPEALQGLAGEFVNTVRERTETNDANLLFSFLLGVGNAIGRNVYTPVASDEHYGNLFINFVGKTGVSKGTGWNITRAMLKKIDEDWGKNRFKSGLSSGEGLVNCVAQYSDSVDRRVVDVEQEFERTINSQQRQGCSLSSILRTGWDSGYYANIVKKDAKEVSDVHLSFLGHVTPADLPALQVNNLHNGYANRFLWVWVETARDLPLGEEIPEKLFNTLTISLNKNLRKYLPQTRNGSPVQKLRRTPEADALWISFSPYFKRLKEDDPLSGILGRVRPQVLRLSLIYAVLAGASNIEARHVWAAVAAWKYCEDSVRYIFSNNAAGLSDGAQALWQAVLNSPNGDLTGREQWAVFNRHTTTAKLAGYRRELVMAGLVREVEVTDDSGRKSEVVRRNSLVWAT